MKVLDKLLKRKKASEKTARKQIVPKNRKEILEQINNRFNQYTCHEISIEKCMSETSYLTADLLVYHFKFKVPAQIYHRILLRIANYYVMLHMDMYTGFYTIDMNFVFNRAKKLWEDTLKEIEKNKTLDKADFERDKINAQNYLWNQVRVDYSNGMEGCLKLLANSIHAEITSFDKKGTISKKRIEEIIRTVQARKFLI
mgnify:CR=1 FL=1